MAAAWTYVAGKAREERDGGEGAGEHGEEHAEVGGRAGVVPGGAPHSWPLHGCIATLLVIDHGRLAAYLQVLANSYWR